MVRKKETFKPYKMKGKIYVKFICPFCKKERSILEESINKRNYCYVCLRKERQQKREEGFEWCGKCERYKEFKDFNFRKDGTIRYCKKCESIYVKKNKNRIKRIRNRWLAENPERRLFYASKKRAKDLEINFDLELKDIKIPRKCPILKIPIFPDRSKSKINSPSIDRIIPELGYTKGNIQIISWRANWLKNNATFFELEKLYEFVCKRREFLNRLSFNHKMDNTLTLERRPG